MDRPGLRSADRQPARFWLWIAFAALSAGGFVILSSEMTEAAAGQPELIARVDAAGAALAGIVRSPALTQAFIGLTALGSGMAVTVFILAVALWLGLKRRYRSVAQLLAAPAGSALLTFLLKSYFERPRPGSLQRLVQAQGYSYPSGHSLVSASVYFTFAVLLCQGFQKPWHKAAIVLPSLGLITLIGLSRAYLGVHYVSDVVAGLLLGIGWAALLAGAASFLESRDRT